MAHEIGHYVLHRSVCQMIPRNSVQEWIEFMLDRSDKEYSFFEYHASEFAGRFLVPGEELRLEFEKALSLAGQNGTSKDQLQDDALLQYLANPISRIFEVSSSVIERRLIRERLWPLQ